LDEVFEEVQNSINGH